eukprot:755103-Hanusia_phi.AAC.2
MCKVTKRTDTGVGYKGIMGGEWRGDKDEGQGQGQGQGQGSETMSENGERKRGEKDGEVGVLLLHPDTCLPMEEKGKLEEVWAWAETLSRALVQKIKLEEPSMHSRLVLVRKKKAQEVLQRRYGSGHDLSKSATGMGLSRDGNNMVLRMKPHEEEAVHPEMVQPKISKKKQDELNGSTEESGKPPDVRATAVKKPTDSQMRIIRNSRNLHELNDWLQAVRERAGAHRPLFLLLPACLLVPPLQEAEQIPGPAPPQLPCPCPIPLCSALFLPHCCFAADCAMEIEEALSVRIRQLQGQGQPAGGGRIRARTTGSTRSHASSDASERGEFRDFSRREDGGIASRDDNGGSSSQGFDEDETEDAMDEEDEENYKRPGAHRDVDDRSASGNEDEEKREMDEIEYGDDSDHDEESQLSEENDDHGGEGDDQHRISKDEEQDEEQDKDESEEEEEEEEEEGVPSRGAMKEEACGVGIVLQEYSDRTVRVVHVHANSPAGREGSVRVGDILKTIDESDVYRRNIAQVAPLILGKRGTRLRLGLLREVEGGWKEMAVSEQGGSVCVKGGRGLEQCGKGRGREWEGMRSGEVERAGR